MSVTPAETRAMRHALALAARGQGYVEPNPMVGCVLLSPWGEVIGEGYHTRFGEAHAEREALADARQRGHAERLAGCTAVVTLEPCNHTGKQPPCTDALVEAKVGRVVAAMQDPDPRVAGTGLSRLRDAGIDVSVGLGETEARRLNAPFLKRIEQGLPWVIAKWAQTLDGKVATATGDSQWISNALSRTIVHELRARVDAVMVGVGTAQRDVPRLTARDVDVKRVARRLVVDRSGNFEREGFDVLDGNDLRGGLEKLSKQGVSNILLEGGPTLMGAMFDAGLVDEAWAFVAPKVLGDAAGRSAVETNDRSCETIKASWGLALENVEQVGGDVWLRYLVER
ncbi:MAG: bifunctional diaminohydroxyphosphoribosylaminopyrimidine deaminase/5-amino-6-(5-phosphoribosylamino)uracil reductase RibD [Planctomycetota bacterium]